MARNVIRECGEDSLEVSVVLKGQGTLKEVHNNIVQRQQLYEKIKKLNEETRTNGNVSPGRAEQE
jgi:hypothetical protein